MSGIDAIVQRLNGRKEGTEYRCECPVHANQRHFIVGEKDGRILFNCKQLAPQIEIIGALSEMGLWGANGSGKPVPAVKKKGKPKLELVEEYHYRNSEGQTVAIKGRFLKEGEKTFMWRMPGADKWSGLKGMKEVDLPLYGTEHVAAASGELPIFVVEGEKAAQACWRRKIVAVCPPGGGAAKEFGDQLRILAGRNLVLWPDNDPIGRALMYRIKQQVGDAGSVKEFSPPLGNHDDAHDYFIGQGKTKDDLFKELAAIRNEPWVEDRASGFLVSIPDSGGYIRFGFENMASMRAREGPALQAEVTAWQEIPQASRDRYRARLNLLSQSGTTAFRRALDDMFERPKGFWVQTFNTACQLAQDAWSAADWSVDLEGVDVDLATKYLVYPFVLIDSPSILFGPGEVGKTYLTLHLALCVALGVDFLGYRCERCRVIYLDYESTDTQMKRRILWLLKGMNVKVEPDFFRQWFIYWPGRGRPLTEMTIALERAVKQGVGFIAIDSAALACGGNPKDEERAIEYFGILGRLRIPSLTVAHVTKDESGKDPNYPFGSIFWHLSARVTWSAKGQSEPEENPKHIILVNKKANEDTRCRPIGLEINWTDDTVAVKSEDVREEFFEVLTVAEQIRRALSREGKTIRQLAEQLGKGEQIIRSRLNEMKGVMYLEKGEDGTAMWGLASYE